MHVAVSRPRSEQVGELAPRQAAKRIARETSSHWPQVIAALSPEDIKRSRHGLRGRQLEPERKNEELRRPQANRPPAFMRN